MSKTNISGDELEKLTLRMYNLETIFMCSLTVLFICIIMSSSISSNYVPRIRCNCMGDRCYCQSREYFKNINSANFLKKNTSNSYLQQVSSSYVSIPLLDPKNEHLFFGQANKYIYKGNVELDKIESDKFIYRLEIFCNLFVLNGNVYNGDRSSNQKFSVVLKNSKTQETIKIGNLIKDGDGIYKLKYISSDKKLTGYDRVDIIYVLNGNEQIVLSGKFL